MMMKASSLIFWAAWLVMGSIGWSSDTVISFETDEAYRSGSIENQNGWQLYGANRNRAVVESEKEAADGKSYLKVTEGNAYLNKTLPDGTIPDGSKVSIQLRLLPDASGNEPHARVFIANSESNRRFQGVSFGIELQDGNLVLFYRDGDERKAFLPDHVISPDLFYRFEVTFHSVDDYYHIQVFEGDGKTPLAEVSRAKFRTKPKEFNHLMLNGTPGAMFDHIRISAP